MVIGKCPSARCPVPAARAPRVEQVVRRSLQQTENMERGKMSSTGRGGKSKAPQHPQDIFALGSKSTVVVSRDSEKRNIHKPSTSGVGERKRDTAGFGSAPPSKRARIGSPAEAVTGTSLEVDPVDLVPNVLQALDTHNSDKLLGLLKSQRSKPDPILCMSMLYLTKIRPNMFAHETVTQTLCTLLKREQGTAFKSKGNPLVFVLACNMLYAGHRDSTNWADTFIKVYIEDALNERWCKCLVENIVTAFGTEQPAAHLVPSDNTLGTMSPSGSGSPLMGSTEEDIDNTELEYSVFPRYPSSYETVEALVLEAIREQIQRRAAPDAVGKGFLELLSATCGFPESVADLFCACCLVTAAHSKHSADYRAQLTALQQRALGWLRVYRPARHDYLIMFVEPVETYSKVDNWPPESERALTYRLCTETPLPQNTLLRLIFIGLSKFIHTKVTCNGKVCYIQYQETRELDLVERAMALRRNYSKQHGRPEENRRKKESDSESDSDSDVSESECKGFDRSEFWRRKMRTVHNILDVDKDGLISFNDFLLLSERFKALGHLDDEQAKEFTDIIKLTWEEQWGAIDPYNFVTVEQYLEDMHHVLNDKTLKKRAHRWLPYLFKAVDKDKSGFISVNEFKLFFQCLGLSNEHAAVAFAAIDTNGDGKVSLKEFVQLGKDFFTTEDETRVSKMFWGPLIEV